MIALCFRLISPRRRIQGPRLSMLGVVPLCRCGPPPPPPKDKGPGSRLLRVALLFGAVQLSRGSPSPLSYFLLLWVITFWRPTWNSGLIEDMRRTWKSRPTQRSQQQPLWIIPRQVRHPSAVPKSKSSPLHSSSLFLEDPKIEQRGDNTAQRKWITPMREGFSVRPPIIFIISRHTRRRGAVMLAIDEEAKGGKKILGRPPEICATDKEKKQRAESLTFETP